MNQKIVFAPEIHDKTLANSYASHTILHDCHVLRLGFTALFHYGSRVCLCG